MLYIRYFFVFASFVILIGIIVVAPPSFAQSHIDSPRKQMMQGVLAENVKCKPGFELILKAEDGSAACVKPTTSTRLIDIGWGKILPQVSNTVPQNNTVPPTSTSYSLAFLAGSNPANIQLFEDNLKPGDYILVNTRLGDDSSSQSLLQEAADIKSKVKPGVNVITLVWYSNISNIESRTPQLPKGIDYVVYDFESWKQTPEFSTDQQTVIGLLDRALKVAHDNNFKLMFTPAYGSIKNGAAVPFGWNWGDVSKHTDGVVIQFQGYFKLSNGDTVKNDMVNIIKQISSSSPNTLAFVQLSLTPVGGTVDQNISAMHDLNSGNIKKFLIFYGAQQTDDLKNLLTKRQ